MDFAQIINKSAVDVGYHAKDKDDALRHMIALLHKDGAVTDEEAFLKDVYAREAEGITGIGDAIAIPHGKSPVVARNCVAVCKLAAPIAWESIDDEPVELIVLFAVQSLSLIHISLGPYSATHRG